MQLPQLIPAVAGGFLTSLTFESWWYWIRMCWCLWSRTDVVLRLLWQTFWLFHHTSCVGCKQRLLGAAASLRSLLRSAGLLWLIRCERSARSLDPDSETDAGSSILFLSCLVRSLDATFAMTTLWRALERSLRGHSWENEGLRGAGCQDVGGAMSIISQMSQAVSQSREDSALLLRRTHTARLAHILLVILTEVEAFNICRCSAAIIRRPCRFVQQDCGTTTHPALKPRLRLRLPRLDSLSWEISTSAGWISRSSEDDLWHSLWRPLLVSSFLILSFIFCFHLCKHSSLSHLKLHSKQILCRAFLVLI